MILEMNNEEIVVKQNSVENIKNLTVHTIFKDAAVGSNDIIQIFIDGHELERVSQRSWRLDTTLITYQKSILKVTLKTPTDLKIYCKELNIEKYISFGKLETDKFPQVFLDNNIKIRNLEKRIEKLEKEKSII